ncbi:MAG: hypothetical protein ACM33U_07895 [Solirubrobacterales bacterium]
MFSTIRARLLWLVVFALVPAIAKIAYDEYLFQRQVFRGIQEDALRVVSLAGLQIQVYVEETRKRCRLLAASQACQAQTMSLWQIQPGFWYRFHKGPEGTLQAGVSSSYTRKETWPGALGLAPVGRDHIVMASFRYYIP